MHTHLPQCDVLLLLSVLGRRELLMDRLPVLPCPLLEILCLQLFCKCNLKKKKKQSSANVSVVLIPAAAPLLFSAFLSNPAVG